VTLTTLSRNDHLLFGATENTLEQKLKIHPKMSSRWIRHIEMRQRVNTHSEKSKLIISSLKK